MLSKKYLTIFILFFYFINFTNFAFCDDEKLEILSPNYFTEQKNIYKTIHYLENEFLSFNFCLNDVGENLNFKILCKNQSYNLDVVENNNKENCFFSNYNLKDILCDEFDLEISFSQKSKSNKIKRSFKKQKESELMNLILNKDFNKLNAKDLSYYLVLLSDVYQKDSKQVNLVIDRLKNLRNNNDKCWPKTKCDLEETLVILRNLKIAGFDLESRMLEDGRIFLEKNVLEDSDIDYKKDYDSYEFILELEDEFDDEVKCELEIDNKDDKNYEFDDDSDKDDLKIEKDVENQIKFNCRENIEKIKLGIYKDVLLDKNYDDDEGFKFKLDDFEIENYNEFKYEILINHSFSNTEEIECELTVDDDEDDFVLDKNSKKQDLTFSGDFSKEIELDCEDDLDEYDVRIVADEYDEKIYTNKDSFDYQIVDFKKREYDFEIDFDYDFSNSEELECELKLDGYTKSYFFDIDDEESDNLKIKNKKIFDKVSFTCENELKKINFKLFDIYGRIQEDEDYENENSFSFSISDDFSEYKCIKQKNNCSFFNTIKTLEIYDDELEQSSELEKFARSFIVNGQGVLKYAYNKDKVLDTSYFLSYDSDEEDGLIDFLKFKQSNQGFWGNGTNKIFYTSFAIFGLENADSDSEHVQDAKKWIYYNEPLNGWNSIENNALAYMSIEDKIKPYLLFDTKNFIFDNTSFFVKNPTIFKIKDLRISFSDQIKDYLIYNEFIGDLNSKDFYNFNVSVNANFLGVKSGFLKITGVNGKGKKQDFLEIPVNVLGKKPFEVLEEDVILSDNKIVIFKENNLENFNLFCDYFSPFSLSEQMVQVSSKEDFFEIENKNLKTGSFLINFNCFEKENNYFVPIKVNVLDVKESFSLNQDKLIFSNFDDFSLEVKNLLEQKQNVEVFIKGDLEGVINVLDKNKILAKGEKREIYFEVVNSDYLLALNNNFNSYVLIKGKDGYFKKIPLVYDSNFKEESSIFFNIFMIFIGFLIIGFVILVFIRYKELKKEENQNQNNLEEDEIFLDDFD